MSFPDRKIAALPFLLAALASQAQSPDQLNSQVTQANIGQTICIPGWTKTIRPPVSYTNPVKLQLLRNAGLTPNDAPDYELDHLVPLALGGHPRNLSNLQLQPWEGSDGAKRKDRLEVKLQCLVCAGQISLRDAQQAIATDWEAAYHLYSRQKCHRRRAR